jgi:N-acetylmuramoyl-L-alanine amidase
MKKLIAPMALGLSLLSTSPAFAYTVQSGDTMGKIAERHGMTLQELASLNPQVKDLDTIYVGQEVNTAKSASKPVVAKSNVTEKERDLLARLVRAEAEGEVYAGKVAVAVVVLNRVDSPDFPDTVTDVIYQKGQFSPVSNGEINRPADAESFRAVDEALSLDRSKGAGSLFFYNPKTSSSKWLESRPTTLVIGNHVFKK